MKRKIIVFTGLITAFFILGSCSSAYIKPTIPVTLYRQSVPGNAVMLMKATQKILPMLGYKIDSSDEQAGTLTTVPVEMNLGPESCDCGTAMGMPVIKNEGTKVKVTFVLGVTDNEINIRADIVPELSDTMAILATSMNLVCVSKGKLEEQLAKNFLSTMKEKALQLLLKNFLN